MDCYNEKCIKHDDTCVDNCERWNTHDIAKCKLAITSPQDGCEAVVTLNDLLNDIANKIQRCDGMINGEKIAGNIVKENWWLGRKTGLVELKAIIERGI